MTGLISLFVFLTIGGVISREILKAPRAKAIGDRGELLVKSYLAELSDTQYRVLHDVMIPSQNGKTTQIDHIVVSRHGKVFVIETKNYEGWITGNETDKHWRQTIYRSKHRFMNPLHQNFGHIQSLKELLHKYTDLEYISIVAFTPRAKLKVTVGPNTEVVHTTDLVRTIQKYIYVSLPIEKVQEIAQRIQSLNIQDKEVRRNHVQNVQAEKLKQEQQIWNNICPKCGGSLVPRRGKYGAFRGCSNYPKCRFVVK